MTTFEDRAREKASRVYLDQPSSSSDHYGQLMAQIPAYERAAYLQGALWARQEDRG